MSYDALAAARVRRILARQSDVTERQMMGALCFMVKDKMCCGVTGAAVMVRVGAASYPRMLREPHARPMEIAGRRPCGFVCIDPAGYRTDAMLTAWIARGLDFVSTLPAKKAAARPRRRVLA